MKKGLLILVFFCHMVIVYTQQKTLKINSNCCKLELHSKVIYKQCESVLISLNLTITKKKVLLYDLETAKLDFKLMPSKLSMRYGQTKKRTTGGNVYYVTSQSVEGGMIETVAVPKEQNQLFLHKGEKLTKIVNINKLFNQKVLSSGQYTLLVEYERAIKDSIKFEVYMDFKDCLPIYIDSLKSHNVSTVNSSRVTLFGMQNKYPPKDYNQDEEYDMFKEWWLKKGKIINHVQYVLETVGLKEKLLYTKTIPELYSKLRTKDPVKMEQLCDSINYLTGYEIDKNKMKETEETKLEEISKFRTWWEDNKTLIEIMNLEYRPE